MPLKSTAVSRRRDRLFLLSVVVLSVAVVAVLAVGFARMAARRVVGKAAGQAAAALQNGFSCTADVALNGAQYEVQVSRTAQGANTMKFLKPEGLSSFTFTQDSGGLKMKYDSIEVNVDPSSIPQSSLFNAVSGAFDACLGKGAAIKAGKYGVEISGSSAAGKFTVLFDKNMVPLSLSMPSLKLSATFKDFKLAG